jgi:ubiquitin C-terminal hydrolase
MEHEEMTDEENLYKCEKCDDTVPATRQTMLWTPPKILITHFKRFHHKRRRILKGRIDFPQELDVSDYISLKDDRDDGSMKTKYKLYAIINHTGGMNFGHYYAYCLGPDGRWREYNDKTIRPIAREQDLVTGNAYVLFYEQI